MAYRVSMSDGSAYSEEPTNTREKIMAATYDALLKHGYAGLSISRIADEADLSKSSFYHHFDGKHDILLSFADYTLEDFERQMGTESTGDPVRDLYTFLGLIIGLDPGAGADPDYTEKLGAYLELRSQAIHDPEFREKFTETSDRYVDSLADIIEDGIEQGSFRDVDPERTAGFLLTIIAGVIVETTTRTDDIRELIWEPLTEYIEAHVVRGRVTTDVPGWRNTPGRLKTYGTEDNEDPRLTTGSSGNHPFFPSNSDETEPADSGDDADDGEH